MFTLATHSFSVGVFLKQWLADVQLLAARMPVGEVIQHDVNGLLVPINDILSLESQYPHSWVMNS